MAEDTLIRQDWFQRTDILMGIGVLVVVSMIIIPIPTPLLDLFQSISILIGIITLLTSMYIKKAYEFSVFPSLLLISTVYRLALNVSSTRLILLQGTAFDGKLIRAFGEFVVGGNYVVGFIIFIILVAVQFIVITRGATRISEVAARFTLDALPGKQVSIEQELTNGLITEEEAKRRREELQQEADFYRAMDGASKFVQGDVIVGIIITIINIVGGIIIGTIIRGEPIDIALKTYTLFTIGDGLVNQIPSLLITTATGIIVTRAIGEENLGTDIGKQFSAQPKALGISGAFLLVSSLIPGFPKIALITLGGLFLYLAYRLKTGLKPIEKPKEEEKKKELTTEDLMRYIKVEPLELEVGYNLIPLIDPNQGGVLLEKISNMKTQIAEELGLIVPPIRIRDNIEIPPTRYVIFVRGIEVDSADIHPDKLMAMETEKTSEPLEGEEFREPAFKVRAYWIDKSQKHDAELKGYLVVDPPTIIITHLTEVIKRYADEIFGRQELQNVIDELKKDYPAVVDDLITSGKMSINELHRIIRQLLREGVPIRNMVTIMETLANYVDITKDMSLLVEYVRLALRKQIIKRLMDEDGIIRVIAIDPKIEERLIQAVHRDPVEGAMLALLPEDQNVLLEAFRRAIKNIQDKKISPIVITNSQLRFAIFDFLSREFPRINVISYSEVEPPAKLEIVETVYF